MIKRFLEDQLRNHFFAGKALLLVGPRQVGKSTLINNLLAEQSEPYLYLNGDDPTVINLLLNINSARLKELIGKHRIIFIDEAQRIPEVALTAKIIVDQFKDVQLIISGSSAFELNQLMQEPLTGRKWTYNLWPISWKEYQDKMGYLEAEQTLERFLVYGGYPDVVTHPEQAPRLLRELADSYLYKDILAISNISKPDVIRKIVSALAYQIGNEISYTEIAQLVGADPKTVTSYIDILEKAHVLFRLHPFSGNLRNEIKSKSKIYFYDNGIRNAIIGQFSSLANRQDVGALWENFLISERVKLNSYTHSLASSFFWRSKQQQEVDYVEAIEGGVYGYEFKWSKKASRFPKTFTSAYDSQNKAINRDNFREFIMPNTELISPSSAL